ncbi:bbx, partial [Drosophila busckii]
QKQRTEDQENAFRQIEDVHNYAKLQTDDGGEVEDDEDDDEGEDDDEEDTELHVHVDDDDDHDIIIKQTHKKHNANVPISSKQGNDEDSEEHVEVDVVTVPPALPQQQQEQQMQMLQQSITVEQYMRPEHHARRPMNAFLIFCKRHRAIVKERYKSLENRAITKILGDWWAALDELEKQCFTDLAQQNKDAFFNANPNFKWYKLPAPPLRTLATRPSNAATTQLTEDQQQQQLLQQQQQQHQQQQLHWESTDVAFKFADETQMGELSALLSGSNKGNNSQYKDYALQQALSETSQFMSHAMPCKTNNNNNNNRNNSNKRTTQVRVVDSASNSSEEGERGSPSKKMKTSRSCKGKIYQELINSGQLAAVAKKSNKCRLNSGGSGSGSGTLDANSNTPPISPTTAPTDCQLLELALGNNNAAAVSNNCDVNVAAADFDLEERIKELPALSLDSYLQRKRSTKKKKKFTSSKKVRNSNSSSSATGTSGAITTTKGEQQQTPRNSNNSKQIYEVMRARAAAAAAAAVGSQKRKARKESITRRDVSAIELEVASILPLTINGCYYFNQSQVQSNSQPATVTTTATTAVAIAGQENSVLSSPLSSSSSSSASVYEQANYDVTSTSDLLILAEVAANSTELSNSN